MMQKYLEKVTIEIEEVNKMWLTWAVNTVVVAAAAIAGFYFQSWGTDIGNLCSVWSAGFGLGYAVCWLWMNIRSLYE